MHEHRSAFFSYLRIGLCLLLIVVLVGLAVVDARRWHYDRRGVESGLERELAPIAQPRYGTNVSLEQYADEAALNRALETATSLGVGVVRQHLYWAQIEPTQGAYDWAAWDRIVSAVQDHGLRLILVLDTSPVWARHEWDADNEHAPAADHADYAAFVQAAAERYQGRVLAYQIWDSPNVSPNWGASEIKPGEYVDMLRQASAAIRTADPAALVLAGGMSPTTETRGRNMSDVVFARELLRLNATGYCDGLAVKAYGFWSGPYDRRVDEGVLNWSRLVLIREELQRLGADELPIWAVEGGWVALPADWSGEPSPIGSDTAEVQAWRLLYGIDRAREEWPWLGMLCLQELQSASPASDPANGLSLLAEDGSPTMLGMAYGEAMLAANVLYPGNYTAADLLAQQSVEGRLDLTFFGNEAVMTLVPRTQAGTVQVADSLSGTWRSIALDSAKPAPLLARAKAPTWIGVLVEGTPEQLATLRLVRVGLGRRWHLGWWSLVAAVVGSASLGWLIWREQRSLPWRQHWQQMAHGAQRLPRWIGAVALALLAALALWAPWGSLRLLALLGYGLLSLMLPEQSLMAALVSVIMAPLNVHLSGYQFSCFELAVLVAAVSWGWDRITRGEVRATLQVAWRRHTWADLAVALYVILGLLAALHAVYSHEALREWRLVFVEPALLYALLRGQGGRQAERAALLLFWAGVGLAVYALLAYAFPWGVIEAEGVRRARAYFGSPNNLAMVLERLLPMGLALGLAAPFTGRRRLRWLLLGGSALMALVIGLTFSRGALLLGLPAGILIVLLLHSRRGRWAALALLVCGGLLLVPLSQTARFAGLADVSSGTTFLRVELWRSALKMIADHPLWGVGPDNFLYYYGDYVSAAAMVDRWLSHPHNIVLDFWLRLGLPGLLLLGFLAWAAVRAVCRALRTAGVRRAMAIGFAGGLAAMLAHGLIDSSLFVTELAGWFLAALALLQGLAPPKREGGEQ